MGTKVHWDPFKRATNGSNAWRGERFFGPFQHDLDRVFGEFLGTPMRSGVRSDDGEPAPSRTSERRGGFRPPIDVVDGEDAVRMFLEIPGVDRESIDVTVDDGMVVVTGEKPAPWGGDGPATAHYSERRWGPFERAVRLAGDVDVDNATASFENGVLTIELPRVEPEPKGRKIKIDMKD